MGIGQRRGGRARGRHRHRARAHHHHRPRNRLVGLRFGLRLNRRGHGGNISNNFGPGFSSPGQMPPELCCHMWMGIFSVMFGLVVFCSLPVFIFGIFSHDAPMGLLIGFPILGSVLIFIGILKVAKTCQALQRETQQTSQEEGNESRLGNDVTSVNMDTSSRLEVEQRTVGAVWTTGQSGVTILPQPVQGQVGYPIGQQTGMGRYGYPTGPQTSMGQMGNPTGQLTSLGQTGCPTGQQTSSIGQMGQPTGLRTSTGQTGYLTGWQTNAVQSQVFHVLPYSPSNDQISAGSNSVKPPPSYEEVVGL
ncbi:uncharacterized protein LOC110973711 [Acanthaster planci]|uniref:Uncharacterized protein LOC110973711 n=1 Tax=Acanthaster planci TaxID=133434 RepID=A0A8B7XKD8_ACAPL|nr:uncharacterized protein LOC110973711 [Acanthaster planci]